MLERSKGLSQISAKRLEQFGGRMPFNSLEKPGEARKPMAKRPTSTDPDKETVDAAMKRAAGKCEGCGDPLCGRRGFEYSIHHRKRRSQGGDNRLSNLVVLCGHGTSGCHGSCHSEIARARLAGFLLLSTENPEDVPVDLAKGQSLLKNDGGVVAIKPMREETDEYADPF